MSLPVTSSLLAPAFLTTSAAGLASETLLLNRFAQECLPDQFRTLNDLHYLYFRHRNDGGRSGLAWIDQMHQRLIGDVDSEQRYREFVTFRNDGTAFAEFPHRISPPPVLNFSEEWGRPEVIPLSSSSHLKTMDLAYFSLETLLFLDTKIDGSEVERLKGELKNRRALPPISVAVSPDRTRFFGIEGVNPSLAASLSGFPYILGRVNEAYPGRRGLNLAQILAAPKEKPAAEAPLRPIPTVLTFQPRADSEFPPLRTTLRSRGRPCPVIIERFFPEDADLLPESLREEMLHKLESERNGRGKPFFRVIRTLDGEIQAISLSFLVHENGVRMRCDRTVKRDLESANQLEGVALAFLFSSLQFMKRSGYWHDSGALLHNLIPRVADAIRRQAGLPTHDKSVVAVALDGVDAREGEEFLRKASLKFEPALPPPTAAPAAAEPVFVDGRPAG